jgi:hypothetical protein
MPDGALVEATAEQLRDDGRVDRRSAFAHAKYGSGEFLDVADAILEEVAARPPTSAVEGDCNTSRVPLQQRCVCQMTSVRMRIARTTLWALCTAIPIHALWYRFVGYARKNVSSSVAGIPHGTCRW